MVSLVLHLQGVILYADYSMLNAQIYKMPQLSRNTIRERNPLMVVFLLATGVPV